MNYTYSVSNNKVYCMRFYAGKTVRGIAKCDPSDTFDLEAGKKLAKARCAAKIAEKRLKRVTARFEAARNALVKASNDADYMSQLYESAITEFNRINWKLQEIEENLSKNN